MDTPHTQSPTVGIRRPRRLLLITAAALGASVLTAPTAIADPSADDWAALRNCESSDRYDTNTGNGYYGAYQFDLPTWRSVGGSGRPDQASPAEQDYRALYLYRMRGWQPWTCAATLGLAADADAASGTPPTRAEAAYISGGTTSSQPETSTPEWPGTVYRYGDCAAPLRTFQLRMNDLGYDFQGTGCYYDKTRRAVLDIQRANDIHPSGLLGPKTWHAAWHGTPPR
ncbi:transglycosylase family protein [Saccharomonospora xinjiangensis]|uniref:transglycosylase family protein n=1 Tax=Saccharomonospora xinjiangensis TaxID=75294 RepID=UPI00106F8DF3|nr:transglycosylase family protein [Saccharomonospora xinjiangensis]QBQ60488.1 Resuscitation-promoting factor Rpf precursor [Saccharomonospora xinjiangensis]